MSIENNAVTGDGANAPAPLPQIETTNRQLRDKRKDTVEAIAALNEREPRLFHGDNGLIIVGSDKEGNPELRPASREVVQDVMADAATWISTAHIPLKPSGFKKVVKQVSPPRELAENFLTQPRWLGAPILEGVVTSPIFARDGTLCQTPGYNAAARLWLSLPGNFDMGDTTPTPDAVRDALALIDDLLHDVSFADQASKAHAFALMLLPFVRLMIDGPTPLHLFDAPTQSSGKSYTAKICISPSGTPVASSTKGDEEEWRKAILAALLSGRTTVWLDNVKSALSSPMLAAAITEPYLIERAMGGLKEVRVKVRCCWVATSNNARLDADTASRCIVIRLDTGMENPERKKYDFDPVTYIAENRVQVVAALCILIRNWQTQGSKPYKGGIQTRFGNWQKIIGGILETNGITDFLGNVEEYRDTLDPEKEAWKALCEAWREKFQIASVSALDLLPLALEIPEIASHLGDRENGQALKLGYQLRSRRDKVFGSFKIMNTGTGRAGNTYKVLSTD